MEGKLKTTEFLKVVRMRLNVEAVTKYEARLLNSTTPKKCVCMF